VEQVSAPTVVGRGSTDREPSGKSTEQPKLPGPLGRNGKQASRCNILLWRAGAYHICCVVTLDMTGSQAGYGAVHPSRSFRFLLMQVSCGLSIGMTDGGVSPPASKAVHSMHWQSCRVLIGRVAHHHQRGETMIISLTCGHSVDTGPTELPARTPWSLVPCPRTELPQPVSPARRRWSTE